MCERLCEPFPHIARFFDPYAFSSHHLGDLGKIRVLKIDAERDHAGLLHLDIDEIERFIVEDDLDHRRLPLHLCQQIAQSEHGETAVAAQRDCLSPRIRQLRAKGIGRGIGHRGP